MIEREPITVVVTEKGWIRALKGHVTDTSALQFKGDDSLKISFFAETTSKILVLATNGKFSRSTPRSCRAGAATASRSG
jgi:topoisomerase-4 subunit A